MTDTRTQAENSMNLFEATQVCLRKYATFRGRARRAEFWWFYLFGILVGIVASLIDAVLGPIGRVYEPVNTVTSLGLLLPTIAATVRRFHDTGRSGWWVLIPLSGVIVIILGEVFLVEPLMWIAVAITVLACLMQLIWLCQKSDAFTNKYGPNPITHPDGQNLVEVFE